MHQAVVLTGSSHAKLGKRARDLELDDLREALTFDGYQPFHPKSSQSCFGKLILPSTISTSDLQAILNKNIIEE